MATTREIQFQTSDAHRAHSQLSKGSILFLRWICSLAAFIAVHASAQPTRPPLTTMTFYPTSIRLGGTARMSFYIGSNQNFDSITGVNFTDVYPAGFKNAATGTIVSNNCFIPLTITADPNANSMSVSDGVIPGLGSCEAVVNVVGAIVGDNWYNVTSQVFSSNAPVGQPADAHLNVTNEPLLDAPVVSESFAPDTIPGGWGILSKMTITLSNPDPDEPILGAQINSKYASGLANNYEGGPTLVSDTCGFVYAEAPAGLDWAKFAGGTVPAGGECSVVIQVESLVTVTNSTGDVPSANAQTGTGASATLTVLYDPDLILAKNHVGNFTQGQTDATYTLTAKNQGQPTTGLVTVSDTLPPSLTATDMNGPGWTCSVATTTCTRSDVLSPPATSYPPITLQVNVASDAPATVTNTASVSGGGELDTSNDAASDLTTITPSGGGGGVSDLTLTKIHAGNFSVGQTGAVYFLIANNIGNGATSGAVTVTDTLPPWLTATSISGPGWNCTMVPLGCTRSDALAAGMSYPAITLTVDVDTGDPPESVTNTASVSGGGELNTANDTASDPTAIDAASAGPDLSLTKNHAGNFSQGQSGAVYSLIAHNVGGASTNGTVTVSDTLPASLTATALSGPGWNCTLAPLSCTRNDGLPAGASYPAITLTVDVAGNAPAMVMNAASASGGGETNANNDAAIDPTSIDGASAGPDLSITKSHAGNFSQGQAGAVYSLIAHNVGNSATTGAVTVSDVLPPSLTATAMSGPGWTCTLATLNCSRGDVLAVGASFPAITLTVNVAANAPATVMNVATASGGGETNPNNSLANDPTSIALSGGATFDLTLTKSHVGNFTQGQAGATYSLSAHNVGAAAFNGFSANVVDSLPAELTATAMSGAGWTCTLATTSCTRGDSLGAGASYPPITLTVTVAPNAPASVTNAASVGTAGEINTGNNLANDPTTITPNSASSPDMTLVKSHAGNFTQGQTGAVYSMTASNVGGDVTNGTVTITDTLPGPLTATALSGPGWNCVLGSLTCTRSDALAAGTSYPAITLVVNVAGNAPASVTNTAAVSGGGEINTANDTASDPTTIDVASASPDLSLSKNHPGNFSQGQISATYSLIARNVGGAVTNGIVTVSDTLPAFLTATALSGPGWNCTLASLSCTRADALAAGASYAPITLTVNVAANAPVSVINSASVGGGGQTNSGNDAASDPTTIFQVGGPDAPIAVGDAIEVAPGDATDALVGDTTPPSSVLDNDFDPNEGSLSAIKLSDPAHGLIAFSPDGHFTYVNDGTGTSDGFTYRACNSSNHCSVTTKVTITIGNGLSGHIPFAVGDAIQLAPGATTNALIGDATPPSSVLDNDIDPDGDDLTATKLTNPLQGDLTFNADGTFSYHHTGQATTDSWLYQACDGGGACDLGIVTITIDANPPDHLPIVVDDAIQLLPGDSSASLIGDLNAIDSFLDNDSDPDIGDSLIVAKVGDLLNASGLLTFGSDGTFNYQNTNTAVASDTALYEACDNYGACTPGIISVSITTDPMDLAPIAADDAISVAPGGTADTLVGDPTTPGSVLRNDSDPDSDPLVAHLISAPTKGAVVLNLDGTFTYVNTDQNADVDEWQYEACDPQGACVGAKVFVTIDHSAPTVTCTLSSQVHVVGDVVNLDLSLLFAPPSGQSLIYSATNVPPSLSVVGSLLSGTLQANDVPGSPYDSTLTATTVPGNVSASESVTFQILPSGEILLRDGFDGGSPSQVCN